MSDAVTECRPEIIFHLAAQPLVGISYREPVETFTINALGTAHLLEAVRSSRCGAPVIVVTSDKCYRNDGSGRCFVEDDPLGGNDVYSMSKAATELVVAAWHSSFFSKDECLGPLATARAGNVIGGGDYAEDRIIPDAVRAFEKKSPLLLRCPEATRPWQHVLESVSGYLALGQQLLAEQDKSRLLNYNFGPDFEAERSVQELMNAWLAEWPGACELQVLPEQTYAEATRLSLNHTKAKNELGWRPVWNFQNTVAQTAAWYRKRHEAKNDEAAMLKFSIQQIAGYFEGAGSAGLKWAAKN